ncbi:MAG: hypothetical protein AAGC60_08760 [Acidobacteriota bacterium]
MHTDSSPNDQPLRDAVRTWLRAERRAETADAIADRMLPMILQALPAPAPSAGFAARVLAATHGAAPRAADLGRRARAVVALALLLTGLAVAVLTPLLLALAAGIDPGATTLFLADALALAIHVAGELAGVGAILARLLRALLVGVMTPTTFGALTVCVLFGLLLLRALRGLLVPSHGRSAHVL